MESQHFSENDRVLYADGYELAMESISTNSHPANLLSTIGELYASMDKLLGWLQTFGNKHGVTIDCRKGCSFCCFQPVFAVTHEFKYLNNHINKLFSKAEKETILQKAIRKDRIVRDLPKERMLGHRLPCPLLTDGKCSVYEARPMACRIYQSTNVSTCRNDYEHPENSENYPALLHFPLRAGRMVDEGFVAGLKTLGIDSEEMRMEEGLIKHLSLES